jgi:hypothetical protein
MHTYLRQLCLDVFLRRVLGFCSKALLPIVLAVPRGSSTTGGWSRQSLKGLSGRCPSCWVLSLNNNNVNSYSQVSILAMGLQRGNSNEMEQRVGEQDRVIEEIQVFHRRSQLWGTQCCKPGITWNLYGAIWLKLETLKWHCILGIPRGLICLCWRCHFMHGSSYAYYNQATFCGGWHLCGVTYAEPWCFTQKFSQAEQYVLHVVQTCAMTTKQKQ